MILSWSAPISVANVGWYPTADGILPNKAETSDPAWVNLKILSTKKRTSWPSWSLKYSANVNPVKATLALAPGGSFIWPYTSAALEPGPSGTITPDSTISWNRSLPSLVLSPTPANTEYPPCALATLFMSSIIKTVLPTPAPPKSPILPPFA